MKFFKIPLLASLAVVVLAIVPLFGEVDLSTPEMQAVREDYRAGVAEYKRVRADQLRAVVERNLADARQALAQQKRSRNITAMAAARRAISVFEKCLEQLEAEGSFDIPEKIRRELTETMSRFRTSRDAIESEYRKVISGLEDVCLNRLAGLAEQDGGRPDAEKLRSLFKNLIDPPQGMTQGRQSPGGAETAGADSGKEPASGSSGVKSGSAGDMFTDAGKGSSESGSAVPSIIASSGEADEWVSFARWHATVNGLEVADVPISGRTETEKKSSYSPMTESHFETRYEAISGVNPTDASLFRVKSITGMNPVDVLQWPSAGNDWMMQFRVRPGSRVPSKHSVELQINGASAQSPVSVNQAGTAPGSSQEKGSTAEKEQPEPGKPSYTSVPGEYKVIQVMAKAGWWFSGIRVKKGDLLKISVDGQWSCGSRKEKSGPAGYPNDSRFRHYYHGASAVKRQLERANYGALLMRIGREGRIGAIGANASIISPDDGVLYFDINEANNAGMRMDNSGSLSVRVARYDLVR